MSTTNPQSEAAPDEGGSAAGDPARRARARRRSKHRRRLANVAGLLVAPGADRRRCTRCSRRPRPPTTRRESAAEAAGRAAVRAQLHHLPRREPPGRAEPRPVADRRRRGRGLLPGAHRPHAAGPPGGRRRRQAADLHRRGDRPADGLRPGQRRRPDAARPATCATATWPRAASCSGSTARPATTSSARAARCRSGKAAPEPRRTPPTCEIYTAMLTGPENMPVFGDNQLTPEREARDHQLRPDHQGAGRPGRRRHRPHRPGGRGPGHLGRRHRRPDVRHLLDGEQGVSTRDTRPGSTGGADVPDRSTAVRTTTTPPSSWRR